MKYKRKLYAIEEGRSSSSKFNRVVEIGMDGGGIATTISWMLGYCQSVLIGD